MTEPKCTEENDKAFQQILSLTPSLIAELEAYRNFVEEVRRGDTGVQCEWYGIGEAVQRLEAKLNSPPDSGK